MEKQTAMVNNKVNPSLRTDNVIAKPLSLWENLWGFGILRKLLILIVLALLWQLYAKKLNNPLLLPTFSATVQALWQSLITGELILKIIISLKTLFTAYGLGTLLAASFSILAINTRLGNDLLETLTAMLNPLPAIALLPLALLWFGLGVESIIFVLIHSIIWPIALNIHAGFTSVSPTLRMVGHNVGLSGLSFVQKILIPAALPQIITGLKTGWAFAWRTLIAAELVFGVSSGSGGLGWFIFENKNQLEIASVFAGLLTVILIGISVEYGIFRTIEKHTVLKWGMKS